MSAHAQTMLATFDWPHTGPVALRPLGAGHINRTFAVTDARGETAVLQQLNPHVFVNGQAVMENTARVCAHLREKLKAEGFDEAQAARRALRLTPTRDGRDFARDAGGAFWRCMPYIAGTVSFEKVDSPQRARAAAFAFGQFSRRMADLPAPALKETLPGFHDTLGRFGAFERALKADRAGRADTVAAEADFVLGRAALAGELQSLGLPERTVHNDTKLNNVLFDESSGDVLCVADLDTVMPGLVLHDFGDLARSVTNTAGEDETDLSRVRVDETLFAALAQGFVQGASDVMGRDEIAHFALAARTITFELGMRFLTDYLDGDVYFRTHRPAQNLDRARVHFRLLESMEAARTRLEGAARRA